MFEEFKEYKDRYEKEVDIRSTKLLLCVDKESISDLTGSILEYIVSNFDEVVNESLNYINENKKEYGIEEIDDFSNPGLFLNSDGFSLYWDSEKGEDKGCSVIGTDFFWPERKWIGLTIGD